MTSIPEYVRLIPRGKLLYDGKSIDSNLGQLLNKHFIDSYETAEPLSCKVLSCDSCSPTSHKDFMHELTLSSQVFHDMSTSIRDLFHYLIQNKTKINKRFNKTMKSDVIQIERQIYFNRFHRKVE